MNRLLMAFFAGMLALFLGIQDAEAKRLGGGTSRGMQRDSVTQRQATPQPGSPTQQAAPGQPGAGAAAAAQPQRRSWLGPIAGLAAGLGLAALFSHLGLGEELASFVMLLLLAIAAVFVFRLLFRRNKPKEHQAMQFAGMGGSTLPSGENQRHEFSSSAANRPGGRPASHLGSPQGSIPPGFDADSFVRVAKVNFLRLQAANDSANLDDIREFTTPEMFAELKLDIDERRGTVQHTDVLNLEAELLEALTERDRHVASVRFHGMIREEKDGVTESFDEVWNLVKPADGSRGWQVAGIQQLH